MFRSHCRGARDLQILRFALCWRALSLRMIMRCSLGIWRIRFLCLLCMGKDRYHLFVEVNELNGLQGPTIPTCHLGTLENTSPSSNLWAMDLISRELTTHARLDKETSQPGTGFMKTKANLTGTRMYLRASRFYLFCRVPLTPRMENDKAPQTLPNSL